jgi:hypothetical protein
MHPEIVTKTMNKADRHSHLLLVKLWVVHFSPYCCHTAQGMLIKPGKNPCIIFDHLSKGDPYKVVLNKITSTKFETNNHFWFSKTETAAANIQLESQSSE